MSSSTSHSSTITSNHTNTAGDGSGTDPQVSSATPSKLKRKHIWISVKLKVRNMYLFSGNENMRDRHLLRQVTSEHPYELDYGQKEKSCGIITSSLSSTRVNLDENLFGGEGVNSKAVKSRFFALMAWCKTWQAGKPFDSGTDDKEAPTDLLDMIEEEYS